MDSSITVVKDSIVDLSVDALVTAANTSLLGGSGVDGAIHRAAGPGLVAECRSLNGCKVGEAKITGGHNLKARFVIHTVGPTWQGGDAGEADLLAGCFRNSLRLAAERRLRSIAFPAISCGRYGFPLDPAAKIAIDEAQRHLVAEQTGLKVVFACPDPAADTAFSSVLSS